MSEGPDNKAEGKAPLALQAAMWRASIRDRRLYRQYFTWKLHGKVDPQLMRQAWEATLRRHGIFSLAMSHDDGNDLFFTKREGSCLVWIEREADGVEEPVGEARSGFGDESLEDGLQQVTLVRRPGDHWELHWLSHHAWMDGRSRRIVLDDVRSAYGRLQAGQEPFTAPAPSFSAFLESRRRLAEAPASLEFWHAQLSGIRGATPLGFGLQHRPQAGGGEDFRTRFRVTLPADLADLLDRRAGELGVTVNSIFQGAWALFLSRTASSERVVFGAPRACRHGGGTGAAGVVGLVMNMVPMAVAVDDHEPVADFLRRIRGAWLAMRPHETVPLVDIAAREGIRDLFESVLAFEERRLPGEDEGNGWHEAGSDLEGWTELPLVIQITRGASIELELAGCGKRFPGAALDELAGRLITLARHLLSDPALPVGRVSLLDEAESARLMADGSGAEAPAVGSVMDRFDAIVSRHGGRIAVETGERCLSYAEISASADRLARALRASGVLAGDRVAVLLDRSPETVVLFLAILRAGAAYVPIDSRYPAARVERILNDATPRILVTRPGGLPGVETGSVAVVTPDHLAAAAGTPGTEEPLPALSPDSPAYVMYSSGSTGEPKGIVIPHRGITRLVVEPDYVPLNPDTRTLQLASLSFDAATFEIWGPLLNGGCCVLYPGEVPDLHTLERTLAGKRVNTAFFTTSLFNLIARENPLLLAPLREVGVGGEALVPEWIGRVYEELPDIRLFNGYGPTENTTFSVCHRIPRDHDFRRPIPLGRPIRCGRRRERRMIWAV
jgi:non-ribosomal peptide synthetase component F